MFSRARERQRAARVRTARRGSEADESRAANGVSEHVSAWFEPSPGPVILCEAGKTGRPNWTRAGHIPTTDECLRSPVWPTAGRGSDSCPTSDVDRRSLPGGRPARSSALSSVGTRAAANGSLRMIEVCRSAYGSWFLSPIQSPDRRRTHLSLPRRWFPEAHEYWRILDTGAPRSGIMGIWTGDHRSSKTSPATVDDTGSASDSDTSLPVPPGATPKTI